MALPAIAAAVGRVALGAAIRGIGSDDNDSSQVSYQAPNHNEGLSRVGEFETGRAS